MPDDVAVTDGTDPAATPPDRTTTDLTDGDRMVLDVAGWVNGPGVAIAELRGRVVLIEAFQMLCPGCVSHGLPQATRVHRRTSRDEVVVLGLHTVFEHHDVTGPGALAAFVAEYRLPFPVAIDRPTGGSIPATMHRYGLQGTPTTLIVDRSGRLRDSWFGAVDDVSLGVRIGRLLAEPWTAGTAAPSEPVALAADAASTTTGSTGPLAVDTGSAGSAGRPEGIAGVCRTDGDCA